MKTHSDWKKAIIHLEGAVDSKSIEEKQAIATEIRSKLQTEENINEHDLFLVESEVMTKWSRDMRYQGTAVFLEHQSRRYLITARHVVEDKLSSERNMKTFGSNYETVFNNIFRVPSFNMLLTGRSIPNSHLMNLNAGVTYLSPFTFSSPELDLAIISLDQRDSDFADELIKDGYSPVSLSDIADEPSAEGADIYAVGYPQATSVLGEMELHPAQAHWASNSVSLPITSYGKVAMLHSEISYFWGDISIYPGNSGGAVIENNKLIGIVSEQPTIYIEEMSNKESGETVPLIARTRIPFAKIIKVKYFSELLNKQIEKDKKYNF